MAHRTSRLSTPDTSTIELEDHQERMHLEARRDYLKQYLAQLTNHQQVEVEAKEEKNYSIKLKAEIQKLEESLNQMHTQAGMGFIKPLLLPKIGKDEAGISKTLSVHFAQLFNNKSPESAAPFVELSNEGIEFYWASEEQAREFATILEAHDMKPQVVKMQLEEMDLPPLSAKCDHSALKNLYCQPSTHVTKIPHLQAEKLLRLAQYHPYHLKAALGEWYQAKGLDHSKVAVLEALKEIETLSTSPLPLQLGGMQRVAYDDKEHLVRVTINTEIKPDFAAPPPHVVILLDDSGSMGGKKMEAANKALQKLIMETLDENTLVSIQPMNADTLVYRKTVRQVRQDVTDQQKNYFNTPAAGGTPLVQLLVNSAVFLREDPQSTIISEAALRNTVIVPITDGEDNGGYTAEQAVLAMQTSANPSDQTGMGLLPNIKLPTGDSINPVSYGVGNFQCRQLPAVLPIRIGNDADAVFSRKLAEYLHAPEAFVNDTSTEMQQQIDYALSLVQRMNSRVPEALVGLVYENCSDLKNYVVSTKEHNFFHLSSRDLFFKVPKDANYLRVCIVVDDQPLFLTYSPEVSAEEAALPILNQYVAKAFDDLQRDYFSKQNVSLSPSAPSRFSGGRRGIANSSINDDEANQSAANFQTELTQKEGFERIKQNTLTEIQKLLARTTDTVLQSQMRTFLDDVQAHQYKEAFSDKNASLYLGRAIASTQQRVRPIDKSAARLIPDSPAKQLCDYIKNGQLLMANLYLNENKAALINDKTGNVSEATPLIFALIQISNPNIAFEDRNRLRQFIFQVLLSRQPDLLLQDKEGNTALHRAAWYKENEICLQIIKLAKEQGTLEQLISCRNRNATGATQNSETPLDNMRTRFYAAGFQTHPKDTKEASLSFKELHKAVTEDKTASTADYQTIKTIKSNRSDLESKQDFSSTMIEQIKRQKGLENYHLHGKEYQGETQLMHLVREAHNNTTENVHLCAFLEEAKGTVQLAESDYAGNTLLHDAVRLQKFTIAEKILDIAANNGQLVDVLAARSVTGLDRDGNGGQVPHMALAAQGSQCVKSFFTNITMAKSLIAEYAIHDDTDFQTWLLQKNKENSKTDEKADNGKKTDAHLTLEILDEIFKRKNSKYNELKLHHQLSSISQTERIQKELTILYEARSSCEKLIDWHALACKMNETLETNAPQKAEFNHLCTVYGKQIEGYNANSFLKACPLYEFGRVKRMYLAFSINHPTKKKEINQLVDYLNKIQSCPQGSNLDKYVQEFKAAHEKLKASFQKDDLVNFATIELLEMSSQSVIEQYKAYRSGELNTLSTLAKQGLDKTEEETTDMLERLESFREAIKCLQVRVSAPQTEDIADAFDTFLGVLDKDTKTDNSTKKIICTHFDDIAKKFMTEDLVSLKEITTLKKDLQIKLMGLPPMSPTVKAAIGVLLGVLVGAVIALTGGMAVVPVALISGATTSSTAGTAAFFHGRKKSTAYQQGYDHKVEPLRQAMDQLSFGR